MFDFEQIKQKHSKIIRKAIDYMDSMQDPEHDINHTNDVVELACKIIERLPDEDIDYDCVIICAYWHDVARVYDSEGHELKSAQMLKEELLATGYPQDFAEKCFVAIVNHKWDMMPQNIEGKIVKDADKVAFLGLGRWKSCLENNFRLDDILEFLPRLRDEILIFDVSRKLYDEQIASLVKFLHG